MVEGSEQGEWEVLENPSFLLLLQRVVHHVVLNSSEEVGLQVDEFQKVQKVIQRERQLQQKRKDLESFHDFLLLRGEGEADVKVEEVCTVDRECNALGNLLEEDRIEKVGSGFALNSESDFEGEEGTGKVDIGSEAEIAFPSVVVGGYREHLGSLREDSERDEEERRLID